MEVTRLTNIEQCEEIASSWDCMAHANPFRRTAWLHSWWQFYRGERELFVLQVTDDQGEVVGIAPWYMDHSVRQGRVIRPLGSGEVCSEHVGILTTVEHQEQVISALSNWLTHAASDKSQEGERWDLLDLVSSDCDDQLMTRFVEQLAEDGCHVHPRPALACWKIELPDCWDGLLARLSKNRRKKIRRMERKWLDSGEARLHTISTADQLDRGMQILVDLHQRRRAALGEQGRFANESFHGFLHEAARRLIAEQALRIHWIELGAEPVSVEFHLQGADTVHSYQSGIVPELLDIQPGHLSQLAVLKLAIEDGQKWFDLLRGDEPYKASWLARRFECVDYRVVPHRHVAQLRHQIWVAGDTMKQWIRTGLHMAGMD